MPKRFTDTEKWKDPWFDSLSSPYKLAWLYMLDTCDCSGVWPVNIRHLSFNVGHDFEIQGLKNAFQDRIEEIDSEKWFIKKFVFFQYGELKETCKPHLAVIRQLEKHNLKGYSKGINTLSDRVQDKEKEKDKEKDMEKEKDMPKKSKFGEFKNVLLTADEKQKLTDEHGEEKTNGMIDFFSAYIAEKGYKAKSHYLSIRRWVVKAYEEKQPAQKEVYTGTGFLGNDN